MKPNFPQVEVTDCEAIRGGVDPILARIPRTPGVYAWFKKFHPPDPATSDATTFLEFLRTEISLAHCVPRSARLQPNYWIELTSHRQLSAGKFDRLNLLCESVDFRRLVYDVLTKNALLFQQPLYVGKADVLQDRIRDHLEGRNSELQERLSIAKINLRVCYIAYIETTLGSVKSDDDTGLVIEELLSRLFDPPFTERYG